MYIETAKACEKTSHDCNAHRQQQLVSNINKKLCIRKKKTNNSVKQGQGAQKKMKPKEPTNI